VFEPGGERLPFSPGYFTYGDSGALVVEAVTNPVEAEVVGFVITLPLLRVWVSTGPVAAPAFLPDYEGLPVSALLILSSLST
jgi:hypothetical protein